MNFDDLRRCLPVEDPAAYDAARAEAVAAGSLGEAIHRARETAGLSLSVLADHLGVDPAELERAEEGDPALPVGMLVRLGRTLGVPVAVSIGGHVVDFGTAAG